MTDQIKTKEELIELLADIEHQRWAGWQKYLHSKCVHYANTIAIPPELFQRWERQIRTPYFELSKEEKNSDREQVRRYWPHIETAMRETNRDGYRTGMATRQKEQYRDGWNDAIDKIDDLATEAIEKGQHIKYFILKLEGLRKHG